MNAKCPNCGKSLKIRDEWAGKTLKCPGCGTAFKAGADGGSAPAASRGAIAKAGGSKAAAATAAAGGPKRPVSNKKDDTPRFAVNSNLLLLLGGVVVVLAVIAIVVFGPIRVKRHWDDNSQQVRDNVNDVIELALRCEGSRTGDYNPRKGKAPTIGDLRFLPEIIRLSIPKEVPFDGFTSLGRIKDGTYDFETGEVAFTLKRGGTMLPSGLFADDEGTAIAGGTRESEGGGAGLPAGIPGAKASKASGEIHVTGRVKNGAPSVELDGKKGEVIMPPALDEDGNPE